jgi:hypothetical protein
MERPSVDSMLGWAGVAAGGVDVYTVPGNHDTLLQDHQVQSLARILQKVIRDAEAALDLGACRVSEGREVT